MSDQANIDKYKKKFLSSDNLKKLIFKIAEIIATSNIILNEEEKDAMIKSVKLTMDDLVKKNEDKLKSDKIISSLNKKIIEILIKQISSYQKKKSEVSTFNNPLSTEDMLKESTLRSQFYQNNKFNEQFNNNNNNIFN